MSRLAELTIQLSGSALGHYRRTIKGSLFGDCNPTRDIPRLLLLTDRLLPDAVR